MKLAKIQELFAKPATWLVLAIGFAITAVVMLICHNDQWSSFGAVAVWAGAFGLLWTVGPQKGVQRWCRRFLLVIPAMLVLPVFRHLLRTGPNGEPTSMTGHIVAMGKAVVQDVHEDFAQPPPLNAVIESKSELLGALRTDYLSLMNTSGEGIFPASCIVHSGSESHSVELPKVVKPYDTVKIELRSKSGKIFLKRGDRVEINCKGFIKPLTVTQP